MENNYRKPKRPQGWAKPYWNKAGNLFVALLASVAISFVGSFLSLLLDAIMPLSPLWERVMGLSVSFLCSAGAVVFFSYQEGNSRRRFSLRTALFGGGLYLLIHGPLSLLFSTPLVAGYMAVDLASILFYGNTAYAIDSISPWLVMTCTVIVDALVYIPLSILGDRWGVRIYEFDVQALQQDHEQRKNGFSASADS